MRELSVVITVMNEEANIEPLLASVRGALAGIDYEIVLVMMVLLIRPGRKSWNLPMKGRCLLN